MQPQPLETTAPVAELGSRWTAERLVAALELERHRWPSWLVGVRETEVRLGDKPGSDLSAIVLLDGQKRSICVRLRSSRRRAEWAVPGVPTLLVRGSLSRHHAARAVVTGLRVLLARAYEMMAAKGETAEPPADVRRVMRGGA